MEIEGGDYTVRPTQRRSIASTLAPIRSAIGELSPFHFRTI